VAIAGLLIVSFTLPEDELPQQAMPIEAVIVNEAVLQAAANLHKEDERKRERQAAEERRQEAAERVEREERERVAQAEAERVAAEQKLQAAADARRKTEDDAKRKAEQQAQTKAAAAQKKKSEEARLKAERELDLRARLAEEEERTGSAFQGLKAQYIAAIQAHVERRWFKPPGTPAGATCVAVVTQIPGGEVVGVRFATCGGGEALRQSIETAIRNASPLPPPPQPSLFEREVRLVFKPEE
jgi:colicin import membrane protein